MKNILTEALVNLATNASFIFQLYKFCKVKDTKQKSLIFSGKPLDTNKYAQHNEFKIKQISLINN